MSYLGGYNEHDYDGQLYADNDLFFTITESCGSTDASTAIESLTKTELITMTEAFQRFFGGQLLSDSLLVNEDLMKKAILTQLDATILTDSKVLNILKAVVETMTMSEIITFAIVTSRAESINLSDSLAKAITDKRMVDTIRLNDWFTIKQSPQGDPWS